MSVDLRCTYVGMAKKLLDNANISTVGQHVRSKAVSQDVRRYLVRCYSYSRRPLPYYFEDPLPCKWSPKSRYKDMNLREITFGESAASRLKICV